MLCLSFCLVLAFGSVLTSPHNGTYQMKQATNVEDYQREVNEAVTLIPLAFLFFAVVIASSAFSMVKRKREFIKNTWDKERKDLLNNSNYGSCQINVKPQANNSFEILQLNEKNVSRDHAQSSNKYLFNEPFNLHPVF